jgi:hypothetical protein
MDTTAAASLESFLQHTDSLPNSIICVNVVKGKQGKVKNDMTGEKMLEVEATVKMDCSVHDQYSSYVFTRKAREIVTMCFEQHATTPHDFSENYQVAITGDHNKENAYAASAVVMDVDLNLTKCQIPIFRPTAKGGHVVLRTKAEVTKLFNLVYGQSRGPLEVRSGDEDNKEEDRHQERLILFAAFENLDVVFVFAMEMLKETDSMMPLILHKINAKKIRGILSVVSIRLCDHVSPGRSIPRMSNGKFKYLFPKAPFDCSLVKSTRAKSKHKRVKKQLDDDDDDDSDDDDGGSTESDEGSGGDSAGKENHRPRGKYAKRGRSKAKRAAATSKSKEFAPKMLYFDLMTRLRSAEEKYLPAAGTKENMLSIADVFLSAYERVMGTAKFNAVFEPYMNHSPPLVLEWLGEQHRLKDIIILTIDESDQESRDKLLAELSAHTSTQ